jgi:hypothetical protein
MHAARHAKRLEECQCCGFYYLLSSTDDFESTVSGATLLRGRGAGSSVCLSCGNMSHSHAVLQVTENPGDSVWAPACLQHTGNIDFVSTTSVAGFTYKQSLSSWYFGATPAVAWDALKLSAVPPRVLIDACVGVNCNPTCPA